MRQVRVKEGNSGAGRARQDYRILRLLHQRYPIGTNTVPLRVSTFSTSSPRLAQAKILMSTCPSEMGETSKLGHNKKALCSLIVDF
jgi:hypothetical protein